MGKLIIFKLKSSFFDLFQKHIFNAPRIIHASLNGYFLDKETHIVKFNSTSRPCVPQFPLAIIQTLKGEFVSVEPDI